MSNDSIDLPAVLRVLKELDSLVINGRALTRSAGQRREMLRAELCRLTGESDRLKALRRARRLRKQAGSDGRSYRPRKKRNGDASEAAPRMATPRPFDATRVREILLNAVESDRRRH